MAFVRVNPGDPIQAQNLDQVIDSLNGVSGKGQPIALTALNDAANYAETIQNIEPTNSRALNVLKSDGTTLIRADATGVTLGAPLNLPTGSVTSASIVDGTIQNIDLGPDVARANLITNPGLEVWQRGPGPFTANNAFSADRWQVSLAGSDTLSVSRDQTNFDTTSGNTCAACVFTLSGGAGSTNLNQAFRPNDVGTALAGMTVSASVRVRTSTANSVRLGLYNGSTTVYSTYHTGNGSYQTLAVANFIVTAAATLQVSVTFAASCTAYIDNVNLVAGSAVANYVPLHPADDLARCLRYYEASGSGGGYIINAYSFAAGQAIRASYFYKAVKPVSPTVTKVGTWTTFNCGQPAVQYSDTGQSWLQTSSAAAGDAYTFPNGSGQTLTIEANP